jgi:hypothetical protein
MIQHILPKGFHRIRYYGLHGNVRYQKMREQLAYIIPTNMPEDPNGYRVLPPKPFQQRFFDSFGKDPLVCPKCHTEMSLELISHPKYGTIKEFLLFEEIIEEPQYDRPNQRRVPGVQSESQQLVQIPLPFL